MKKFKILLIFSLIILTVSGCGNQKRKNAEVTLATSKNMWCGLALIAYEKGYFKDEGLDVKISYLESGRYCLDALVSNSTDFATIVEPNIAYFGFTGNKSVIDIASIVSSTSSGIIALKSRGINKPEDLKGKMLAFSPGTTSDIFANRFIEKHGLTQKDVKMQKIQPLAISGAILSGSVDAASTWDPHIYNISKSLGSNAIVFRDPDAYTGYLTVAVRKEWAYKNKETVISFLKALKKAEIFANKNKDEAQSIVSKMINLDIDVVRATWALHLMEVKLDKGVLIHAVTSQGKWINQTMDDYKGKPVPDYTEYFDSTFLETINSSK
jgi:ABC-type nitrate/sulfonate/bicarbonate transport system substrate-binding protein